jgi:DNA-binding CsgD family transcriptional regulator
LSKRKFSKQEEQVLRLAMSGLSDRAIAEEMALAQETVRTYWKRIRAKTGNGSRAEIVACFATRGAETRLEETLSEKDRLVREVERRRLAERKLGKALDEVHLEKNLLSEVLRQMPSGVIIAEAPTGRILMGNERVEQIFRHPVLHSASIEDYSEWIGFHPDGRRYEVHEWPLSRALREGQSTSGEDIEILRGDGTRAMIHVSGSPVRDSSGEIVAGVVVLYELEPRR